MYVWGKVVRKRLSHIHAQKELKKNSRKHGEIKGVFYNESFDHAL